MGPAQHEGVIRINLTISASQPLKNNIEITLYWRSTVLIVAFALGLTLLGVLPVLLVVVASWPPEHESNARVQYRLLDER